MIYMRSMNREFLLNVVFLIFINLLIKPLYLFGVELSIQNRVAEGMYGLYFNLLSLALVFQIVNDLGIQYYNNRHVAQHSYLLPKYFPGMLLLKAWLGLAYLALLLLAAWLWRYEAEVYPLLLPIAANQMLLSLVLFLRSNISGLAMYRTDSLLSVLDRLLLIIVCGGLLITLSEFRIEWFVYAQTFSLAVTAVVAFAVFHGRLGRLRFRFRPALLLLIVKKSAPYALSVFLMAAYTRIDGVMVERLLPQGRLEADVYASAYRLLDAGSMLGFLFAGLLMPMFARMLKSGETLKPLFRMSLQLIWAGSVTLAVAIFFFRNEIMMALYTNATNYSGQVLGALMLTFVSVSCLYIYGPLLTANGSLRRMNRIFAVGIVLNVVLNAIFIPRYGALGAAVVTFVTQTFVALAEARLAHRILPLPFEWRLTLQLALFAIGTTGFGYFFYYQLDGPWLFRFVGCSVSCLLWAIATRLIAWQSIRKLLASKAD